MEYSNYKDCDYFLSTFPWPSEEIQNKNNSLIGIENINIEAITPPTDLDSSPPLSNFSNSLSPSPSNSTNSTPQILHPAKTGRISKKQKKEKASHNQIEKKYRTNINEKILALRDCVPSLKCLIKGPGSITSNVDLDGLTPANKLNKATVLTKAQEYIEHLQRRNEMLIRENNELRKMALQSQNRTTSEPQLPLQPQPQPQPSFYNYNDLPVSIPMENVPFQNVNIQPENLNYDRPFYEYDAELSPMSLPNDVSYMQYPTYDTQPQTQPQPQPQSMSTAQQSNIGNKIILGSMAGIMGTNLMSDFDTTRGLSIPFMPFISLNNSLMISFKVSLILGILGYIIIPYLMSSNDFKDNNTFGKNRTENLAPEIDSELDLFERSKQIWMIYNNKLDIPSSFSKQFSLIFINFFQFVYKFTIGYYYDMEVNKNDNSNENEEIIKWEKLIDSQLCGGDLKISNLRLFYSFIKLCSFGNIYNDKEEIKNDLMLANDIKNLITRSIISSILSKSLKNWLAFEWGFNKLSTYFWNSAKVLTIHIKYPSKMNDEILSKHLLSLLLSNDEESPLIIPEIQSLLYNITFQKFSKTANDGYNSILNDGIINSIHDVLLILYSSYLLKFKMIDFIENYQGYNNTKVEDEDEQEQENKHQSESLNDGFDYIISISPKNSTALRRCLVLKAIFSNDLNVIKSSIEMIKSEIDSFGITENEHQELNSDDLEVFDSASDSDSDSDSDSKLDSEQDNEDDVPQLVEPISRRKQTINFPHISKLTIELKISLHILYSLYFSIHQPQNLNYSLNCFTDILNIKTSSLNLLTFSSIYHLLSIFTSKFASSDIDDSIRLKFEEITGLCRIYIGDLKNDDYEIEEIDDEKKEDLVDELIDVGRLWSGIIEGY